MRECETSESTHSNISTVLMTMNSFFFAYHQQQVNRHEQLTSSKVSRVRVEEYTQVVFANILHY